MDPLNVRAAIPTKMQRWEHRFESFLREEAGPGDAAHDLEHIRRVVASARRLGEAEGADGEVVVAAAWLHDCVQLPKHSARRAEASRLSADAAGAFLRREGFREDLIPAVEHAIHAHSFSAGVAPRTLEARVVQDADRLDALGAIGIARTLMLGGAMGLPLYSPAEPIPRARPADDRAYVLDHFFAKLLTLQATMQTESGRREAVQRTGYLQGFLRQLEGELSGLSRTADG